MAFIDQRLPTQVEVNAVKRDDEDIEIVTTDGGHEVRNARSSQSLREFDISFPAATYGPTNGPPFPTGAAPFPWTTRAIPRRAASSSRTGSCAATCRTG